MKTPKTLRRPRELARELLGEYFIVEGKRITADLYFDTFAEIIDPHFGGDSVERIHRDFFQKLDEVFALIPRKYNITVRINIRDFGDYTPEEADNILRENIALEIYGLALESRRKRTTGLILLGGGVALLLASYFLSGLNRPQILFDIINISGTLLVWESASVSLIDRGAEAKRARQYLKKFSELKVVQA